MIPVYYFDKLPEKLPEDDACYIVSKYIYLKKKSGLIDSMVRVDTIDMGDTLPEYAKMNLPIIQAETFGKVVGFFKMVYGEYKSEAGVILNLKTHPTKPNLKKIDFTIPHQQVSGGGCKYDIVVNPSYINCGTIHSHSDFAAYHSGTDVNDEKYFDGLHITIGHVNTDRFSMSACVVVNGKRIQVDPLKYIKGIRELSIETKSYVRETKFYKLIESSFIIENKNDLKMVTPRFPANATYTTEALDNTPQKQTEFNWGEWNRVIDTIEKKTTPCEECIYKEIRVDSWLTDASIEFDDEDDVQFNAGDKEIMECYSRTPLFDAHMESDMTPTFKSGEIDEDGNIRRDASITYSKFIEERDKKLGHSVKCNCGTTYFIGYPEDDTICPSCDEKHPGRKFTIRDFIKEKEEEESKG
jgi:hypothetical protein